MMSTPVQSQHLGERDKQQGRAGFRPDIQGLRAVAVLLVALSHAGVHHLAGGYIGVDVFFVISGYLITGWLLRHSQRTGRVPFREFYAARARRILPAAALTLVATTIAAFYLLNVIDAQAAFHDSLWAAFFAANIHFSQLGTNYLASSTPPSPIQHYWSLAVEEQFYLAWPALMMLVLGFPWRHARARRHARTHRSPQSREFVSEAGMRRLTIVLGISIAVSLAWSVSYTSSDPTAAYFSTFTRAFELGIGALVAVTASQLSRIHAAARAAMSWLGLAGVLVAAVTFGSRTPFPGSAALLPVLSSALVITGGLGESHRGAALVLGRQPLRFVGDLSYSFYLWHWPVLILASEHEGHSLSAATNLVLLAGAFALSTVTYYLFENPIHRGKTFSTAWLGLSWWPTSIAAVSLTAVIGLNSIQVELRNDASATVPTFPSTTRPTVQGQKPVSPYVLAVADSVPAPGSHELVPRNVIPQLTEDKSLQQDDQCIALVGGASSSSICHLGAPHASRTLVVFGDSHAQMWLGALTYFAEHNGWQLIPIIKQGCVALEWSGHTRAPVCTSWDQWALQEVARIRPTAIILATAYSYGANAGGSTLRYVADGMRTEAGALAKLTQRFLVLEDTPHLDKDPTTCLLKDGATLISCTYSVLDALATLDSDVQTDAQALGGEYLPTLQWFCADKRCPSVIDDTAVYLDAGHISSMYADLLEVPFAAQLNGDLG